MATQKALGTQRSQLCSAGQRETTFSLSLLTLSLGPVTKKLDHKVISSCTSFPSTRKGTLQQNSNQKHLWVTMQAISWCSKHIIKSSALQESIAKSCSEAIFKVGMKLRNEELKLHPFSVSTNEYSFCSKVSRVTPLIIQVINGSFFLIQRLLKM